MRYLFICKLRRLPPFLFTANRFSYLLDLIVTSSTSFAPIHYPLRTFPSLIFAIHLRTNFPFPRLSPYLPEPSGYLYKSFG